MSHRVYVAYILHCSCVTKVYNSCLLQPHSVLATSDLLYYDTDGVTSAAQSAASWSGHRHARSSHRSCSQRAAKNGQREADRRPPGSWSTQLSTIEAEEEREAALNWANVTFCSAPPGRKRLGGNFRARGGWGGLSERSTLSR